MLGKRIVWSFALLVSLDASTLRAATRESPVRTYFIAADNVDWDYAPSDLPLIQHVDRDLIHLPQIALKTYTKAVYHEYTDASFQTLKAREPQWEHLGMLGPVIRAEVGDTVKVVFKNNTGILCTMHPHGLSYDKASEGAYYYQDGLTLDEKKGSAVRPHECFTYVWTVPESAGPGPHDPSSILWMYHSHFQESRDINTGLFGPIIVTRKGQAKANGTPKDVDREFVVAFAVYDESESAYFLLNLVRRNRTRAETMNDPNLRQAIMFYTMNGFTYGNLPMLTMKKGERVRWYLFSSSNGEDVHSPHWHGQTVISNMMRTDTLSLGPMAMSVADMVPDNVGIWLFHCHVNDHLDRGMVARFTVAP
jgi:FtsP/CotA-like multicopper oxidase with cupredoxin domain